MSGLSLGATPNRVTLPIDGVTITVPGPWLRLQCLCTTCQIPTIRDRKFALHSEPSDVHAVEISGDDEAIMIRWSTGHDSVYPHAELSRLLAVSQRGPRTPKLWGGDHTITRLPSEKFWADDAVRAEAIRIVRDEGIVIISGVPSETEEIARFLHRLGIAIRETPFARVHDVKSAPGSYTIADTTNALPPHNDLASYTWPPSGQILHMLRNCKKGGDSIVINSWAVVEDLRRDDPAAFDALATVRAPHRTWSETAENFSNEPIVRIDATGDITGVRYSNQTLQPLSLNEPRLDEWYAAYRELGRRLDDPVNQVRLRLDDGDLFLINCHRILHGRTEYSAEDSYRHIQDSYFELDDLLAIHDRLTGIAQ